MNRRKIILLARELRKKQTPKEKLLWEELRNRKLNNLKFLRQHPIVYENDLRKGLRFFIADFYCAEKRLVIELDGKVHDFQKAYDENRDLILKQLNLRVLRIKNDELKNIEEVKEKY
ncbi:endonuclease domain-containing protein [Thermoflavifilum thermophilum]|uniref:Very-short-patch-repair endonuclease n=1 Tax=Thermoflavifilum thermophilum TaxID=1393122 RepID=A0A1I7MYF9_9BACT|nr:endonuclease domain-containing protein [Thermoflavifilum thermophilum]SFV27398.1 Very-short-patch-repair endonuclease [Thermoflavifilum thermophilum]